MRISLLNRSEEIEIMDDLECNGEVVFQTLRELDFINKWLGGNQVTISGLERLWKSAPAESEITIVDLGCGSGEMLRIIALLAKNQNRRVKLIGIDANPNIVQFAKERSTQFANISFQSIDIFSEGFQQQTFDIVIGTLFFHHFTNNQLIDFFSILMKRARIGILVNDIHRHALAFHSIRWLTALFSKSKMVKYDAPLSVRRAFKKSELKMILDKACVKEYSLQWRWAFRWQLLIVP
jgi:SAM-dependent methyltransferase